MQRYLLIALVNLCLLALVACGSGSIFSPSNSNGINQPGNLIADTGSIATSGDNTIHVVNNGGTPVIINSGEIHNTETVDEIEPNSTDCFGKTLSAKQSCKVIIKTYPGEAGIAEVQLNTNNGAYIFPINVDTVESDGVYDSDIKSIDTTKEQVLNIVNKGSAPITLKAFNLESDNTTLQLSDTNCLNNKLDAGKYCQMKIKASASQNKRHILYMHTDNQYLKTQQLQFYEATYQNRLILITNESSINTITLNAPGAFNYTVKNNGSNDIHINQLGLTSTNIGTMSDTCSGQMLQAGDTCTVSLNVTNNAYGTSQIIANTTEVLESSFAYNLIASSKNLFIDNSNDVVMHTNTSKTVTITNPNAFDIYVSSLNYNSNEMQISSSCGATIKAGDSCSAKINALNMTDDNSYLLFDEFNGGESKLINVHITDGVATAYQPSGNIYYTNIPNDGNFYQVFVVTNNSVESQNLELDVRQNDIVNSMRTDIDLPSSSFLYPNCITGNDAKASVQPNSHCEIILREHNNLAQLEELAADESNPDKGNFRIGVDYNNTNDSYLQKYEANVAIVNMHKDAVYNPGDTIEPNYSITPNWCGFANNKATIAYNGKHPAFYEQDYSFGSLFTVQPDNKTIFWEVYFAINIPGKPSCFVNSYLLSIESSQITLSNNPSGILDQKPMPTSSLMQVNWTINEINNTLQNQILPQSYCNGTNCSINLNIRNVYTNNNNLIANIIGTINFLQPAPAKDWTEASAPIWQDLGSLTTNRKNISLNIVRNIITK